MQYLIEASENWCMETGDKLKPFYQRIRELRDCFNQLLDDHERTTVSDPKTQHTYRLVYIIHQELQPKCKQMLIMRINKIEVNKNKIKVKQINYKQHQ